MTRERPSDRGFFREAEDGSPIFYPWGLDHRGYRLPGEEERARALRAVLASGYEYF